MEEVHYGGEDPYWPIVPKKKKKKKKKKKIVSSQTRSPLVPRDGQFCMFEESPRSICREPHWQTCWQTGQ